MTDTIKNHTFNITVGTAVGLIVVVVGFAYGSGINMSSAESKIYQRIQENTNKDKILEKSIEAQSEKLETHVKYSYTIKSDLKKEIDKTNEKLDKIYDYIISN